MRKLTSILLLVGAVLSLSSVAEAAVTSSRKMINRAKANFDEMGGRQQPRGVPLRAARQRQQAQQNNIENRQVLAEFVNAPDVQNALNPAASISEFLGTVETPVFGSDLNLDGKVDRSDVAQLAGQFGSSGANLPADLNRDGRVGLADLALLQRSLGATFTYYVDTHLIKSFTSAQTGKIYTYTNANANGLGHGVLFKVQNTDGTTVRLSYFDGTTKIRSLRYINAQGLLATRGDYSLDTQVLIDTFVNTGALTYDHTFRIGGAGFDASYSVSVGPSGDVFLGGSSAGGFAQMPSADGRDAFFTRLDSDQQTVWFETLSSDTPGTNEGFVSSVTDANGFITAVGYTNGPIAGNAHFGQSDVLIVRYSPEGDLVWVRTFGTALNESARGVALDPAGNFYVTGFYLDTQETFTAKFDSNGNRLWIRTIPQADTSWFSRIIVDQQGNAYVFNFTDPANFDRPFQPDNVDNAYIAKYDTNGNRQWIYPFPIGQINVNQIAMDGEGNIYVAGLASEILDEDEPKFGGYWSSILFKMNSNGELIWMRTQYLAGMGQSMTFDDRGYVYVAGTRYKYCGSYCTIPEFFVTVYTPEGDKLADRTFAMQHPGEQPHNNAVQSIAVAPDGQVYVLSRVYGGSFEGEAAPGGYDAAVSIFNMNF